MYFQNYGLRTRWLNKCLKSPISEDNQHGKRAQILFHSGRQHIHHIYWFSWKKFLLVLCKILRLFFSTLTVDHNNSLLNGDNLTQPIQIILSKKQKTFSAFFSPFLKSTLNFENFQKTYDPHSRCISEITVSERVDYKNELIGFGWHRCIYKFNCLVDTFRS